MNSHINKIQYLLSGDIFIEIFSCYLQSVRQEKCEFLAIKKWFEEQMHIIPDLR